MFESLLEIFHISPKSPWGESSDYASKGFKQISSHNPKSNQQCSKSLFQDSFNKFFRLIFGAEVDENFNFPHSTIMKWWKYCQTWSLRRPQLHGINELRKAVLVSSVTHWIMVNICQGIVDAKGLTWPQCPRACFLSMSPWFGEFHRFVSISVHQIGSKILVQLLKYR